MKPQLSFSLPAIPKLSPCTDRVWPSVRMIFFLQWHYTFHPIRFHFCMLRYSCSSQNVIPWFLQPSVQIHDSDLFKCVHRSTIGSVRASRIGIKPQLIDFIVGVIRHSLFQLPYYLKVQNIYLSMQESIISYVTTCMYVRLVSYYEIRHAIVNIDIAQISLQQWCCQQVTHSFLRSGLVSCPTHNGQVTAYNTVHRHFKINSEIVQAFCFRKLTARQCRHFVSGN